MMRVVLIPLAALLISVQMDADSSSPSSPSERDAVHGLLAQHKLIHDPCAQ
eukprot:COSAG01_NODE_57184_length_313_cov_242.897196_1_plen_50_part_01